MKLTDEEKERYAEENYRYIHYFVKKYHNKQWDYEELVGAASLGMTQALNTFDTEKGIKFSTYSARCMINAIWMFMRKNKRHLNNISIDQPIYSDKDGHEITILDSLSSPEKEIDWREISPVVSKVINKLPDKKRKIMLLLFENKNQPEIAKITGISQSYVSRIVNGCFEQIKKEYWKGENDMAVIKMEEYLPLAHLTAKEVAEKLGVTPKDVSNFKFRYKDRLKERLSSKQSHTDEKKHSETISIHQEKTAEYDEIIKTLKKQLETKDNLVEQLKSKIEKYEHISAACEDVETELAELISKHDQLKDEYDNVVNQNRNNDYLIENQKGMLSKFAKEMEELQEENKHLKYFALKQLGA